MYRSGVRYPHILNVIFNILSVKNEMPRARRVPPNPAARQVAPLFVMLSGSVYVAGVIRFLLETRQHKRRGRIPTE